jgi:hypothetical protein
LILFSFISKLQVFILRLSRREDRQISFHERERIFDDWNDSSI